MANTKSKTTKMAQMAVLSAIVVVLQVISYSIKIGTFNLSLVLIPIVLAGVLFSPKDSAFLGGVFGAVVLIACIIGADAGGNILWLANPFLTAVVCLLKGIAAGLISGLCFQGLKKWNSLGATFAAAIVCPVVNTGIFLLFMSTVFRDILSAWAGSTDILSYMIVGLTGINFLIELGVNLVFSPAISQIIKAVSRNKE